MSVMMVNAWNPQTRTVVDGDAFAFRRFVAWLRAAILRGGHDDVRRFKSDDDEDSDDEDSDDERPRRRDHDPRLAAVQDAGHG